MSQFFPNLQSKANPKNKSDRYKDYYNQYQDYRYKSDDYKKFSFQKEIQQTYQSKQKHNQSLLKKNYNQLSYKTAQSFYASSKGQKTNSQIFSPNQTNFTGQNLQKTTYELQKNCFIDPKKNLFQYVTYQLNQKQKLSQLSTQNDLGYLSISSVQNQSKNKHQYFEKALKISQENLKQKKEQSNYNQSRTKSYSQFNNYNPSYYENKQQILDLKDKKQSQLLQKTISNRELTQVMHQSSFAKKVGITKNNKVSLTSVISANKFKSEESTNKITTQTNDKQIFPSFTKKQQQYKAQLLKQSNLKIASQYQRQIKQLKSQIKLIQSYIFKAEEEGTTLQDIKRIKKQIKIMKSNFQMAFTSMTDQINRKLVKKEDIMINLSEQITKIINQNIIIKDTLAISQRNVANLNTTLNSYMKQSQERLENIFNDSSIYKKGKNSFQYGLDLKSSNLQSETKMNLQLGQKIQDLQKQLKRVKIFHIQQKQKQEEQLDSLKIQLQSLRNQKSSQLSKISQKQIQTQVRRLKQQIQSSKDQISKINAELKEQISQLRSSKLNLISVKPLEHDVGIQHQIKQLKKTIKVNSKIIDQIDSKLNSFQQSLSKKISQFQGHLLQQKITGIKSKQLQVKIMNIQQVSQIHQIKLKQTQRINQIQTQNIESINSQFQRVINKEIIPKFSQFHHYNSEINFKLNNLTSQFNMATIHLTKINSQQNTQKQKEHLQNQKRQIQQRVRQQINNVIQAKLQNFFKKSIQMLLKDAKIFKAKKISQKEIKQINQNKRINQQEEFQTYLIDQEGYLMDKTGCYLLQTGQNNSRVKIHLSEEQIFLLEVNGVNITQLKKF